MIKYINFKHILDFAENIDNYLIKKFGKPIPKMSIIDYIRDYWKVFILIYILNIGDIILTLRALEIEGLREANPIMNALLSYPHVFIISKLFAILVLFAIIYNMSPIPKLHKTALGFVFMIFLFVDINNIILIL